MTFLVFSAGNEIFRLAENEKQISLTKPKFIMRDKKLQRLLEIVNALFIANRVGLLPVFSPQNENKRRHLFSDLNLNLLMSS